MLKYRPEIDGLRALAVAFVVIYHADLHIAGIRLFPGGFIGVDIFFVVSGYLITSILLRELSDGEFSIRGFYERRVRRIVPTLLLVLLACAPLAWVLLPPESFKEFAESALASVFFISNFYFWLQDSYTAEASAFKPLLHTWSLAIEEQFYLLFPLLLLLLWRKLNRHMSVAVLLIALASLQLADWESRRSIDTAFYLLPTRLYELLAGALLANIECTKTRTESAAFPLLGAVILVASAALFHDRMRHPSYLTVPPIIGTMLIVWYAGQRDLMSRLLSSWPLVSVGLISYSIYLWHHPVFVFARFAKAAALDTTEKLALIALSVSLAAASWRLVEQPFRRRLPRRIVFPALAGSASVVAIFSILVVQQNGFRHRFPALVADLGSLNNAGIRAAGRPCWNRVTEPPCRLNAQASGPAWVLLGDSMVRSISEEILQRAIANNQSVIEMTQSGCHYAPGMVTTYNGIEIATCDAKTNKKRRDLILSLPPSFVLIHGNLQQQISGEYYDNREGGREIVPYRQEMRPIGATLNDADRQRAVQSGITNAIRELLSAGHKVILVYPVPEAGWKIPNKIVANLRVGVFDLSTSYDVFRARTRTVYETYDAVGEHRNLARIYPERFLCNAGRCTVSTRSAIYYSDSTHLSRTGAAILVDRIFDASRRFPSN